MIANVQGSWKKMVEEELYQPYFQELYAFLVSEKSLGYKIYPDQSLYFDALSHVSFEKIKVVIVGQDPYHGKDQAHGLAFSVKKGIKVPPSLKNIFKELNSDLGIPVSGEGCLTSWADQGVLLLNCILSVREGEPKSHANRGWEIFTDKIIEHLAHRRDPIVFMLWGKSAQDKVERVLNPISHSHTVLVSAHPSPYSAHRFLGCRHFSIANQYLQSWGKQPIDWKLD
ncbi:MAG: uracil-DNA glycosylase [Chlamydiae bacterium]|nr:uracil-DNA glycosylase [Chlamydiota bacterium]